MSKVEVDAIEPQSGTALTIGASGDTITVPTGAGLTATDEIKSNKIIGALISDSFYDSYFSNY